MQKGLLIEATKHLALNTLTFAVEMCHKLGRALESNKFLENLLQNTVFNKSVPQKREV